MVDKIPSMVDMSMDAKDRADYINPSLPKYPYGLSLSLCQDELDKLDIDKADIGVGDMLHLHCLGRITSVSTNATESGDHTRVEIQITHIASESEDEENKKVSKKDKIKKFYL